MSRKAGWLRLRLIHALGGAKKSEVRKVVYCPIESRSKPFAECATCPDCEGVAFDPEGKRTLLFCKRNVEDDPLATARTAGIGTPVASILRRETVCVRPETSVTSLTNLLLDRAIGGVPVVDEDGKAIGIVSRTDLLRRQEDPPDEPRLERGFHVEREPETAADVMTPAPISIIEAMPISEAAAIMAFEGLHHLPVRGSGGTCVGMLSSLDVLRWLARTDGYQIPDCTQLQREKG